jgi:DNA-binding NarL/FixJ family response regulator
MSGMNGFEVLERIHEMSLDVKVIILTVHNEIKYLVKATEIGVDGYIMKDADYEDLRSAVLTVYNGERYIQPKLIPYLNHYLINKENSKDIIDSLTKREVDVLRLLAKGGSNRDIAVQLDISERTVKNHILSIFKKINVTDRTQAAIFAIKNDLIDI